MAVSSMTPPPRAGRRRPPGPFYTTLRLERGRALIGAHGEIDLTTHGALGEAALSVLDRPLIEEVFLDLGSVAFLDASGLGALVIIGNAATRNGKKLVLCNVPTRIAWLLGLTALAEQFTVVAAEQGTPTSIARRDEGHLHER